MAVSFRIEDLWEFLHTASPTVTGPIETKKQKAVSELGRPFGRGAGSETA
jgi:hypothetical protein